jgi:Alanine racemase, N-terminal domain
MSDGELTRRGLIAGAGALAAAAAVTAPVQAAIASDLAVDDSFPRSLGAGGRPTTNEGLARLAREHGKGEPVMFVDLAAVDRNAEVVVRFARAQRWHVRPALKVFQSPKLCAYILHLLPEPRGLVFHLRTVDQIMTAAPAGTDLLMGYPPTRGELRAYLTSAPPQGQRPHRLTLLASSLEILQDMAQLARTTPRRVPLDVGLEFDSGEGRGGFHHPPQISQAIKLLRRERRWLRLRAVLCYDGHATASGAESWRQFVAKQASGYFKGYLDPAPRRRRGSVRPREADPQRSRQRQLPQLGGQAGDQRDQPRLGIRVRRLPTGRVRHSRSGARIDTGGAGAQGRRPVPVDRVHQGPNPADHRRGVLPQGIDLAGSGRHPARFRLPEGRPRR